MNILFYCDEYPPYKAGGIGSVTKIVAEELVSRGHNVYIIGYYPYEKVKCEYTNSHGVHVFRYNLNYRDNNLKYFIYRVLRKIRLNKFLVQKELSFIELKMKKIIHDKKIDIVEFADFYLFNSEARNLKFIKFEVPTILRVHGSLTFMMENDKKVKSYIKQNDIKHFQRCDYVSAVSNYSLQYILNRFYIVHFLRKTIIYNPIENDFLKKNDALYNNTILFIGKLVETKGCFSLLKAFNLCASKYPNLRLRLIGGGDIELAKKNVDSKFKERVEFLGYCTREIIAKEIDNCFFACIPTYFENLEVMARGKTLIFTERTSGKEIIKDGVNGFLVNPQDVYSISEKINSLMESPEIVAKVGLEAYYTILQNFTCSRIVDNMETFYSSIIKREV